MTPKRLLLLIFPVLLALCGCPSAGGAPAPGSPIAVATSCADAAVHAAELQILGDVNSALATGDWLSALTDLAKTAGTAVVSCAVADVESGSGRRASLSGDVLEQTKVERAAAWLQDHPAPGT